MSLVSVVILNYNGKNITKECVNSVLKSTYKKTEIIIVDNGSTDGSYQYLKGFYSKTKNVKIVRSSKNLYFTGGNNFGAKYAQGKFLIFLNNDTLVDKNFLKEMVSFIENNDKWLVQPKILKFPEKDIIDSTGGIYIFPGFGVNRGHNQKDNNQYQKPVKIDYCVGTCLMIKRKFFEKLGDFDNWFKYYYEDVDLALRAKKQEGICWYNPKALIYHQGSVTFKRNVDHKALLFNIRKNIFKTVVKNFSGWQKVLRLSSLSIIYFFIRIFSHSGGGSVFTFLKNTHLKLLKLNTNERPIKLEGMVKKRYLIASKFTKGKTVLDIGCGFGDGANLLAKNAKMVYAVDLSPAAITYAKLKFKEKNIVFERNDVIKIKHPTNCFDVITAFEIIEHIPIEKQKTLMKNIACWLKKDGLVFISTPNKLITSPRSENPLNPYHTKEFTPKELKKMFKLFFKEVKIYGLKCKNNEFLKVRKKIDGHQRRKMTDWLSKFKLTHKILPFIPSSLKNFFSFENTLPKLKSSDFIITRKNINRYENLLAICQNKKK